MKNWLLTGLVLVAATLTVLSFFVHRLDKESELESL